MSAIFRRLRALAFPFGILLALIPWGGRAAAAQTVDITVAYSGAVSGPLPKIMDGLAQDFMKENPGITVKGVYSSTYQEIVKRLAAAERGDAPQTAILLSTDMFTLIDAGLVVPFDDVIKTAEDKAWMVSFFPAFMLNSRTGGKTWGIPFQRSMIVLYWNKDAFKEAGLDPNRPPATWTEQVEYARKLTKRDAGGGVTRWGLQVPSSGFPYWLFQGFTTQNDVLLVNEAGTQTFFDAPAIVEALQYWVDLGRTHRVMAPGVIDWGTTPRDFFDRKIAMMWTTSGNLTHVKENATFGFGVAMLPAGKRRGSPTGGANFYLLRKNTPAQQAAVLRFIKWITSPERAAQWGIATGYVAVRPYAWQTPAMKKYVAGFPAAAVARDQLPHAVAELSTRDARVTKALNDGLQAALTGVKTPAQAMRDAQAEADRILRPYQR